MTKTTDDVPLTIEQHLTQIQDLMARGQRKEPAARLEELIRQMGDVHLDEWRHDIGRIVSRFEKKSRRQLTALLDPQLDARSEESSRQARQPVSEYSIDSRMFADLRRDLASLRDHHIYQWSTYYRDCLEKHFGALLKQLNIANRKTIGDAVVTELNRHATDIFAQGYDYLRAQKQGHEDALQKSINGLSKFLALPLDFYSSRSLGASDLVTAFALRSVFSSAVTGILTGYASTRFGRHSGSEVLPRFQRQWVQYMAFACPDDAERVIDAIEPGPLASGLRTSVLPLLDALQKFFERTSADYFPVPIVGQYSWHQRRLDVAIRSPRGADSERLLEASAFLEEGFVSTAHLDDALVRAKAIVAPLRPDVRRYVESGRKQLAEAVVAAEPEKRIFVANEAFRKLDDAIYALRSKLKSSSPISYNIAREFPLHDPNKAKFFHVTRTSVRDLLRTFERHNGVRLWCSVRRSGKTTACFDLGSTTGNSTIVSQTCGVAQSQGDDRFFTNVRDAIRSGAPVADTFISDLVTECTPVAADNGRMVLVIDEYETLFGHMRLAEDDPRIRLAVLQPILNQLMLFSQDNLLVFLGQQPDAHFILMDQNQLAPYVKQDSFPLFEHVSGTTAGEFSELVGKVFSGRIECRSGFMDGLFEETAGHPYLTVNVLVEFVEWLIQKGRSQGDLRVDDEDFVDFAGEKLTPEQIGMSGEYEFFRTAAASAMSPQGYSLNRWLYTVYWTLRYLSEQRGHAVERSDFVELVGRIPVPDGGVIPSATEILRTAAYANFLSVGGNGVVTAKVRLLGRIAGAVRPVVG